MCLPSALPPSPVITVSPSAARNGRSRPCACPSRFHPHRSSQSPHLPHAKVGAGLVPALAAPSSAVFTISQPPTKVGTKKRSCSRITGTGSLGTCQLLSWTGATEVGKNNALSEQGRPRAEYPSCSSQLTHRSPFPSPFRPPSRHPSPSLLPSSSRLLQASPQRALLS